MRPWSGRARARHDEAPREVELVDARTPRTHRRLAAAGLRGRDRGGAPMRTAPALLVAATLLAVAACSGPSSPTRLVSSRSRGADRTADRRRGSTPWSCHATTARTTGSRSGGTTPGTSATRRAAAGLRIRDLPRRAGRLPGVVGIAPRADRRTADAFHYAQRAEIGPQVDDLPVDERAAHRLRSRDRRRGPRTTRDVHAAAVDDGRRGRHGSPRRPSRPPKRLRPASTAV